MREYLSLISSLPERREAGWFPLDRRELILGSAGARVPSGGWPAALSLLGSDLAIETRQAISMGQTRVSTSLSLLGLSPVRTDGPDSRILLALLAERLHPGAAVGTALEPDETGLPRRQLLPVPLSVRRKADQRPRPGLWAGDERVLFSPPSGWPWNLDLALRVLAGWGEGALLLRLRGLQGDTRPDAALEVLDRSLFALRSQRTDPSALERAARDAARFRGGDQLFMIEVFLETHAVPGRLDEMVAHALFGCGADTASAAAAPHDLRGVVTVDSAPVRLLSVEEGIRPMGSPRPCVSSGDVEIGRLPGGQTVILSGESRMRHTYVVGGTGTGKSSLLRRMIAQDAQSGASVVLLDPHGDLSMEVARDLAGLGEGRLQLADAANPDGGFALDLLSGVRNPDTREPAFDAFMSVFRSILYESVDAFGPMFEQYFRSALFLLALGGSEEETLSDLPRVFTDAAFRKRLLELVDDPLLQHFWLRVAPATSGDQSLENFTPYITSKLTRLIGSPVARRIFSRAADGGLDFSEAFLRKRVLLLRVPKGDLGAGTAGLAAAFALHQLADAILSRSVAERSPVRLYVDEMQACPGDTLAMLLAEGRKFGVSLTLANQSLTQVGIGRAKSLANAVLANAANLLIFRVGAPDATALAPWLEEPETWRELCRLPDFHLRARLLDAGAPRVVRLLRTLPPHIPTEEGWSR